MARRTKKRLTVKKKPKHPKSPEGAPSHTEWVAWRHFASFVIESNSEEIEFRAYIRALILPHGVEPTDDITDDQYWIGVIRDIRARSADSEDVWARVQWYWDGEDVARVIKSLYERIFSDTYDYVSTSCFSGEHHFSTRNSGFIAIVGLTKVKTLDECLAEQGPIGENEFFSRCDFEYRAKRVTRRAHLCLCATPFNPDTDPVIHFCARKSCRAGYHQSCLVNGGYWDQDLSDRRLRLVEAYPDHDRKFSYKDHISQQRPRKRRKFFPDWDFIEPASLLGLPEDLVRAAEQPIVKGTEAGGVVGNVAAVIAARRRIYDVYSDDKTIPEDWRDQVDVTQAIPLTNGKPLPAFLCPSCNGPI
ncbi:hypothetical protein SERLA73DRAFT_72145 [Serpula lacrymans var. lacrymans S7.3]|uniref:BAH domain-containing protein n=2 Tax=Serpula lacrymans var. lacrymans TaxID=341189 RepID=F8PRU0_SERL3|nr:uncharacterized protein SERLADRAFT_436654 [Serpula lacrymans var. lacrymans S7.9]EGO01175.1 hypothetical protein SERLA73DRAFT_72145 [Serpula lacrymans var. lacrymans S7.3]EGO26824.1 hypothetical protein SERLADRAFT_436654 [Serpula lacrymans var. lacrymans S7.9]